MRKTVVALVDVVLYSNLWIACCALAMVWQTTVIAGQTPAFEGYAAGIFFGSLCLYTVHRLIGMNRRDATAERFAMIRKFRISGIAVASLSGLSAILLFGEMEIGIQSLLAIPVLIAGLYALPVLGRGRRLRDLPYFKVFLIALVWGWITALIPALDALSATSGPVWLLFAERSLFIFGITIPFDIRDLYLDKSAGVRTVPALLGQRGARTLAGIALSTAAILAICNPVYPSGMLYGLLVSFVPAFMAVWYSTPERSEWYYSGFVDGLMILQFLLVLLAA